MGNPVVRDESGDRSIRQRLERGAAAVEFALVSVLLFPLLLGIIDYGLWFNDSLNTRQGVREAARQGVVQNFSCTGSTQMAQLVCMTKQQIGAISGPSYAMVKAPQGWGKGKPLIVCAMVQSDGITGITPLPSNRIITAKIQLSIEVETPIPSGATANTSSSASSGTPAGANWNWCA